MQIIISRVETCFTASQFFSESENIKITCEIMTSADFIVDIQACQQAKNFIFKEVCVLSMEKDAQPIVLSFKPPFSWYYLSKEDKLCNTWLSRKFHGLRWDDGEIPYDELQNTLKFFLKPAMRIFVKGSEKLRHLSDLLPNK